MNRDVSPTDFKYLGKMNTKYILIALVIVSSLLFFFIKKTPEENSSKLIGILKEIDEEKSVPTRAHNNSKPLNSTKISKHFIAKKTSTEMELDDTVENIRLNLKNQDDIWDILEIINNTQSDDNSTRKDAIDELGFYEEPVLEPIIIDALLNDESTDVRAAAAAALETHDESRIVAEALVNYGLNDTSIKVRDNALLSLSAIQGGIVQELLIIAIQNQSLLPAMEIEVKQFLDQHYMNPDPLKDLSLK